jgi:putative membrane protein
MKEKNFTLPIITISIAIPMAVCFLILGLKTKVNLGFNTSNLPLFHAILNSTTAILLLASLYFIKNRRVRAHRTANLTAVVLSSIFLISYVIYHSSNPSVRYGDLNHDGVLSADEITRAGNLRYVY